MIAYTMGQNEALYA